MDEPFRILVVCSGNVCRSPVAERLLQAELDQCRPGGFVVQSAGTRALVGQTMTERAAGIVRDGGGDANCFFARQLTKSEINAADLILALSRAHRSAIVQLAPAALRRTFTLREFGRMARHLAGHSDLNVDTQSPRERWKSLVSAAPLVRPETLVENGCDDDVADPYGHNGAAYQRMSTELRPAVEALVTFEHHYSY